MIMLLDDRTYEW